MKSPACPTCGFDIEAKYPREPEFYDRLASAMKPWDDHTTVVELLRMDYALERRIDRDLMERVEWKRHEDHLTGDMVVRMRLAIYGKAHPEAHIIRYPSDWWQAVKERFAPAWFRDRYPVKFTEHHATLKELYPDVTPALPDQGPVMKFQVLKREVDCYDW